METVMTPLPNFLLVGAAKAGTTSLYTYLKSHPEIFLSTPKEPRYFSAQILTLPQQGIGDEDMLFTKSFSDYCALFAGAGRYHAVGEASTDILLYHEGVIPLLRRTLGDPRIVIILRHPCERAYSAYLYMVRENRENRSFEEGLRLEEQRIAENWSAMWRYQARGMYFRQVEAFLQSFSRVLVLLYDDLQHDPMATVRQVYRFLEVDTAYRPPHVHTRFNVSGIPRVKFFNNLFLQRNSFQRAVRKAGIRLLEEERWIIFRDRLRASLYRRPQMKAETRDYLQRHFREDILRLQGLLGRDLSGWLQ